jgi:hypothetical protein
MEEVVLCTNANVTKVSFVGPVVVVVACNEFAFGGR